MRRFHGASLIVATHNHGKLRELAAALSPLGIAVTSSAELGLAEPVETEDRFAGNARLKAQAAARATGQPCLADDSGLEVAGLQGAPGVRTADWAQTGSGRDYALAMARIWRDLEDCGAPEPRSARFCCVLAMAWPDGHDEVFEGTVEGRIVWPGRGIAGHGYDPIFQPEGWDLTYGEMQADQKALTSHRARAVAKLAAACLA